MRVGTRSRLSLLAVTSIAIALGAGTTAHAVSAPFVTQTLSTPGVTTNVDLYDGNTRYGTGVAASQAAFPVAGSADAVVLARGDVFADALSGIPLAKYKNGPLLLTPGGASATALNPNVQAELIRVLPRNKQHTVYILGGVGAIPQTVEDYIRGTLGYTTIRLSGSSRFDTALAVATDPRALNNPQNTVVARGDDFADALAAGPYAANPDKDANGVPAAIVLSSGSGLAGSPAALTQSTANYLLAKFTAGQKVLAIGGGAHTAVVALPGGASHSTSIFGGDRYSTAASVASAGWGTRPGLPRPAVAGIASGVSFPDALTGGAYMALKNGPILLVDRDFLNEQARYFDEMYLGGASPTDVAVFGGPNVIDPEFSSVLLLELLGTGQSKYTDHHLPF